MTNRTGTRICITILKDEEFTVSVGDRYVDYLCWDEMLAQIAELTHPELGTARFEMLTAEEWEASLIKIDDEPSGPP